MDSRFIHLLTAQCLTILVGLFPYIFRRTKIAYYFAGAHVCLALWCLNESVAFLPVSHHVRLVIFRMMYIIGVLMVWYFFYFLLGIADIPVSRFPKSWRLTQVGGVVSMLLTLTPWQTANINEYAHPFREIPGPAYPIFIVFMLWGLGLPLYQLGKAYKNTHGHTRMQLKYLFIASCFAFLEGLIFFFSLYYPTISYYYFYLQVIYGMLLAYAIFAHHLMDITVIIRKTLEYSLLMIILAGIYVGLITVGAFLIERWAGLSSAYSAAVAAAAVALLFHPLRMSTQEWVDKRFFRQRVDPEETWDVFSGQLSGNATPQDVGKALLEVIEESVHLKRMGLYLRTRDGQMFDGHFLRGENLLPARMPINGPWAGAAVLHGIASSVLPANSKQWGIQALFPMSGSVGLMGFLLIGEKLSEKELDESDRRLIEGVLQQAALAYEHLLFSTGDSVSLQPGVLADVARGFVHEIKTPLANISLPAQATMNDLLALEQGKRSADVLLPKFKERMKFIMMQAVKASDRVDAIREFAAVEDTHVEAVDLSQVVNESISSLEPLLEKTGVRVHFHLPDILTLVRANPKQLEIVFVNLIKNAAEAMADKSIPVQNRHLWINMMRESVMQVVEIIDSGPGFKPEQLEHLFERYYTTKGTSGTGVGLYFTRQLLTALGGTITASGAANRGAAFTIKLPALESQNSKAF